MFKSIPFILLILFTSEIFSQHSSPCGNWTAYKDEKCYKLFNHLTTWSEASNYCHQQDDESSLVIIKTKEEQDAIVNIIKASNVADNVWIGITRKDGIFKNTDQTDLDFKNWANNRPMVNKTALDCVDMSTDEQTYGKWFDKKCQKRNVVICQKIQAWSITILQNELLDIKRKLSKELDLQKQRLMKLEENPVPIGFIYVQLLNQSEPKSLWPNTDWQNISPKLAGLFFRVEGEGAADFGKIQEQQTHSFVVWYKSTNDNVERNPLTIGPNWKSIWTSSGNLFHHWKHNGEEIRPKNSAIKVWQRIK